MPMTLKSDAKFEGKLICCFKNDKSLVNFSLSTRNSQYRHFDWFVLCKISSTRKSQNWDFDEIL